MPRFVFVGRQCRVASDDFYLPALVCCIFRSIVVVLAVLFIAELRACSSMQMNALGSAFWFANGTILLFLFLLANESFILHISSQGTMANCEHRILLQPALLVRSVLISLELLYAAFGIFVAASYVSCLGDSVFVLVGSCILSRSTTCRLT